VNGAYPWRTSLKDCWTNASSPRALIISHGGDWGVENPYDSMGAFEKAASEGSDCVKGDFRVSKDNVGVVCHSSPIQWYESVSCQGKKVEELTAAEITKCKMATSSWTFMTVPDLLKWSAEKVIVMLCIKNNNDMARAISTIIEAGAQDRVFLEVRVPHLLTEVMNSPNWQQVYYLAEGGSKNDLDTLLNAPASLRARTFAFEFDDSWPQWGIGNVTDVVSKRLHPVGIRSLAATPTQFHPSVAEQVGLYNQGFDIVYTYDTPNAIEARTQVDKARGVVPP